MRPYKPFLIYLLKFAVVFCVLYFGCIAVIGLSAPGNYYSPFVAKHLNFIDPLRRLILSAAGGVLSVAHYHTFFKDPYTLALPGGGGVRMIYSCIGYGVMSFWAAFVLANGGSVKRKGWWLVGGLAALMVINILRVALLLLATHKRWGIPLGWDHHTWFNVVAYGLIFTMIYLYDRSGKGEPRRQGDTEGHGGG